MSPRRNRPARGSGRDRRGRPLEPEPLDPARLRRGIETVETWRGERWRVRHLTGEGSTKVYRCPGCDHEVRPGVAHVVVWPEDAGLEERRHWHTACWRARDRRSPWR